MPDKASKRKVGHSALRVKKGEIEKFDPHPAGETSGEGAPPAVKPLFERVVTHEMARKAYQQLHDAYFCQSGRVTLSVPRAEYDVDILLCDYIDQQKLAAHRLAAAEAANRELRAALQEALIPIAALVVSGECVNTPTALSEEVKLSLLHAHETCWKALTAGTQGEAK